MNYQQAYSDYSTFELLKITKRPGNLPRAAVDAATEILKTRSVTLEDLVALNLYFREQDKAARKKEANYGLNTTSTNFDSMLPAEAAEPPKWLPILILLMVLYYGWTLYSTAQALLFHLECKDCNRFFLRYVSFLPLLYLPVGLYMFFKRKRWGWIILFAHNLFQLISSLFASYSISTDKGYRGNKDDFYLLLAMKALFVLLLWRDSIAAHYDVSPATKRKTLIGTIAGSFLFVVLIVVIAVSMG